MGTNFYATDGTHIGKRSAAGNYCWDCKITLCPGGIEGIHNGKSPFDPGYVPWPKTCPKCGRSEDTETINSSAAGRELGFNTESPAKKSGIRSCSSFTWAIEPGKLEGYTDFVDSYGRRYSRKEFMAVLEECPISFTDSIGIEFS